MNKYFYIQMDSGSKAPLLISAQKIQGIRYSSDTLVKIYTSGTVSDDVIELNHGDDSGLPINQRMQAFLVNELQKLLSTPATGVAPLLIPPVPITGYGIS